MHRKIRHSAATNLLRKSLSEVRGAQADGITRRQFLTTTAAGSMGLALAPTLSASPTSSRIVVIGAGLAGLRFAHALWTHRHIATTVYEASERLGGRVWSNTSFFAGGQVAENGAEFISSEHLSMRRLAEMFELELAVVNGGSEPGYNDAYWLDGAYYEQSQLTKDLNALQPKIDAAYASAPFPQLYNRHTGAGYEMDHTSAADWIEHHVDGGAASRLGRILLTALLSEYGCEPSVQSALNLIYLLGGPGTGGLAGTDEKYHVIGGNDQIPFRMAAALPPGSVQLGLSLAALRRNSDGTYTCTLLRGSTALDVVADHVVLALPFNQLKKVDLSAAGLSTLKRTAIHNFALGTNAKLALQFDHRVWSVRDGWSGGCYTAPDDFQLCWDGTVSQKGRQGILERFPAGNAGGPNAFPGAAPHGPAPDWVVQSFLRGVDAPFPGCSRAYNGRAYLNWWATDPFVEGAYGCYQVGNITSFAGIENQREGNVHFCGEQTSLEFQGYMEGAVRSAERLALNWPRY